MVDRVSAVLDLLAETPYLGRAYSQLGAGVRGIPVGQYVIFYRIIDNGIQVLRVPHGARDVKALFGHGSVEE
jgi:toxin ParE1/3/4